MDGGATHRLRLNLNDSVHESNALLHARETETSKPAIDIRNRELFKRVGADFLNLDIETARTFVQIALTTKDPARRERNGKSARRAYDTVLRFTQTLGLSESDVKHLKRDLHRLKGQLRFVGRKRKAITRFT